MNAILVIHGATGDLASRKLFPALAELSAGGRMPAAWRVIASGRSPRSSGAFADEVAASVRRADHPAAVARDVAGRVRYAGGDLSAGEGAELTAALADARQDVGDDATVVHVLSVPPVAFEPITAALGELGLNGPEARVVYDKPFGTSLASFRRLDRVVRKTFGEAQVFRIDHFLGKEATRNLHVLRFANALFAHVWSRRSVRAVQIDAPEALGVGDRGDFYDETGAVRDMLATHLFQVAAEVAMEPPASRSAEDLARAREAVLRRFRVLDPADVVLGQFEGYHAVDGVATGSRTPTFAAARLWIDTPRWRGVPFLLRTGKRMHRSAQAVTLLLQRPPGAFDDLAPGANAVQIDLAGGGRVALDITAKAPGDDEALVERVAEVPLGDDPTEAGEPLEAYARVLSDVLANDRSLATRPDGLAHVWKVVQPVLDLRRRPLPYAPGSWGPAAAARLAAPDRWRLGG